MNLSDLHRLYHLPFFDLLKLLGFRQTWAFALGKFLTDPIWWFYLFWLPAFLADYTPGKVAEITGIPETDIRAAARGIIAATPVELPVMQAAAPAAAPSAR